MIDSFKQLIQLMDGLESQNFDFAQNGFDSKSNDRKFVTFYFSAKDLIKIFVMSLTFLLYFYFFC